MEEMTRKLIVAANAEDVEAKAGEQLKKAEELVVNLTAASDRLALKARGMDDLNQEAFSLMVEMEQELKQIKEDLAKNTEELVSARKELGNADIVRSYNEKRLYIHRGAKTCKLCDLFTQVYTVCSW